MLSTIPLDALDKLKEELSEDSTKETEDAPPGDKEEEPGLNALLLLSPESLRDSTEEPKDAPPGEEEEEPGLDALMLEESL